LVTRISTGSSLARGLPPLGPGAISEQEISWMHESTRWVARVAVALVVSLSPGWASAAPPRAHSAVAPPVVARAAVDQLEPDRLVIRGKHFGVKSAPTVWLAKVRLEVLAFSDEQIVARLPIDAPAASYRLQVFANGGIPSQVVEVTVEHRSPPSST
jgi:hypothetical protein